MHKELQPSRKNVLVVIPTFNPSANQTDLTNSVASAIALNYKVLILHTETTKHEREIVNHLASESKISILSVNRADFNHGATRNLALDSSIDAQCYVFISQDVIVDSDNLRQLVSFLEDNNCAMVSGRQIARPTASEREKAFRELRYPQTNSISNAKTGLLSNFSNAFAAYSAEFLRTNPFPVTPFGEDIIAATTALSMNLQVGYCSSAACIHSHHSSLFGKYQRAEQVRILQRYLRSRQLDRYTLTGKSSFKLFVGILAILIKRRRFREIPIFLVETTITFLALYLITFPPARKQHDGVQP